MSIQECALYGELVRHLRDLYVERLAELDPTHDATAARAWVDQVIRDWFFTPQQDLHGDAPRDVIWREQKGEPNNVPKDHMHELFDDDCPVCQAMKEMEDDSEWHWHYDDGGFPLIAEYDPDGWDARWAADMENFKRWETEHPNWKEEMERDADRIMREDGIVDDDANYRRLFGLDPGADDEQ